MMQVVEFKQGSPEWLKFRETKHNASEAPAMAGESQYETRGELIKRLATGIKPEIDSRTQALFDEGHRSESLARSKAESIIGDSLYPVTGYDGDLSASFDGLTMDWSINFEHKSANAALRKALPIDGENQSHALPKAYLIQMQQQMFVSGAKKTLFMASKWDGETCVECRWCWVDFDPVMAADIVSGWMQLKKDVEAYRPEPVPEVVTAAPIEALPAVVVNVGGELSIMSNLDLFGGKLKEFVGKIVMKPSTDQEFADAEQAVKALQKAQDALEAAQANALAQISDVEKLTRLVSDLSTLARTTRLALSKSVESRKEQIKLEIIQEGKDALAKHIADINAGFVKPYMPAVPADFGAAIKGKRTVQTLREAMLDCLAKAKIEADTIGKRITANLAILTEFGSEHKQLFPDAGVIVLKQTEDVTALVKSRIAEFKEAEEKRLAAEKERADAAEKDDGLHVGEHGGNVMVHGAVNDGNTSPPAPAPRQAAPSGRSEVKRPSDHLIISTIAKSFYVSDEVALRWIKEVK